MQIQVIATLALSLANAGTIPGSQGLQVPEAPASALAALVAQAEKELESGPLSVMHKKLTPSSGDKHDYMSVGPYWWPDPSKPDGLPYIRKDGERNPERNDDRTDSAEIHKMFGATQTLMLAYGQTKREDFARHAVMLLRGWFLDPATRMNPNLNYGQAVPGVVEGRGTGIIDTAGLVELTRNFAWLDESPQWTREDRAGMKKWCADYLKWLQTSKNGKDEAKAANNHGTWYDAQIVSLALYTGQKDLAKGVLEEVKTKRIDAQIQEDGSMPLELARTKPFAYSLMNLRAFFELAQMGDAVGVDLWNTRIRTALDYLKPYGVNDKRWPHYELGGITRGDYLDLLALLRRGALAYKHSPYDNGACSGAADVNSARFKILWPVPWIIDCF